MSMVDSEPARPFPLAGTLTDYHGRTHMGLVRQNNEDSFVVRKNSRATVFVVADGIGGHEGGEIASSLAVRSAEAVLIGNPGDMRHAYDNAHATVLGYAQAHPSFRGMGTTLVSMRVSDQRAVIGNVGDSRAYLYRMGHLMLLTEDHSDGRVLLNAIGGYGRGLRVDLWNGRLLRGDVFLLCTDGLTNAVTEYQIESILSRRLSARSMTRCLVEDALRGGGPDNITVVVAKAE